MKSHNIVAFYDDKNKTKAYWNEKYAGKWMRLTKNGIKFDALIADTCGNADCNNCCSINSKKGYLVDLEYYTALKNFGSVEAIRGTIQFEILGKTK